MALFPGRVQINEQDLVDQQRERIQLRRPRRSGCRAWLRPSRGQGLDRLQVTPYLHCNARFDMPSRESRRSAAYNSTFEPPAPTTEAIKTLE
ncbi:MULTISPECIES: hypothetical protein [unclassified Streptomyces]|uniref:hypothetical protein n=1 Tax=unclassified Streptomyces TaxID=2593676 RepID=UPI002E1A1201